MKVKEVSIRRMDGMYKPAINQIRDVFEKMVKLRRLSCRWAVGFTCGDDGERYIHHTYGT